jgi:hypothetical protein
VSGDQTHFDRAMGLYRYTSALYAAICGLQLSVTQRQHWWGGVLLIFVIAWCRRAKFRFLWERASWFRWSFVLLLVLEAGVAVFAGVTGRIKVGQIGALAGFVVLLLILPAENHFFETQLRRESSSPSD